jgi:hypothetical protein
VVKPDGDIRICGDYPLTINPVTIPEPYPLPLIHDLFAKLSGGTKFSKLDLTSAYHQFGLSPASQLLTTINTISGLYAYTGMPFGITNASSIFQREMDNLLSGLTHVTVFQDDILVTGSSDQEHLSNLEEVFKRLSEANLRLHEDKCKFFQPSVKYLGHIIDARGLHPLPDRIQAIVAMPFPTDVHKLKSFLGMVNYYSHFLPDLSSILAPLYALLKKNSRFTWANPQKEAFQKVKDLLTKSNFLSHYRHDLPLRLSTDASPDGVGAVLSHVDNELELPVAFASRSLTHAERNYAQLDREALAVVFAVKKFSQYLYGRRFHIVTDHMPLVSLFSSKKHATLQLPPRMLRWKLFLSSMDYSISHRSGKLNLTADALSRLPVEDTPSYAESGDPTVVFMLCNLPEFSDSPIDPIDSTTIARASKRDDTLSLVMNSLRANSWPSQYPWRSGESALLLCPRLRVRIPAVTGREFCE